MKIVRSWPRHIPHNRNYVEDQIPRMIIDGHDYKSLADLDDDVVLLEWDIAVSREDLVTFAEQASEAPGSILAAPYRLYIPHPVWCHRHWAGQGPGAQGARFIATGDETCNLFGLGLTYLPRTLIRGFIDSGWSRKFGDVEFSMWHYHHVSREARVTWRVWPVHLNYVTPSNPLAPADRVNQQGDTPMSENPKIAALLRERAALEQSGKSERVALVDKELKAYDYKDPRETPPQKRSTKPVESVEGKSAGKNAD